MFVFFFKQKTAYEMRISDWSSDVCSSDLRALVVVAMRHLVADHRTDRAIVVGRIRRRIEEWRLQDRRRKHDFVLQRAGIRIDSLRRHRPFGLVDQLADLAELPEGDRKSVVVGTRVSNRVNFGGGHNIKNKKIQTTNQYTDK